jgi:hypothetical protein
MILIPLPIEKCILACWYGATSIPSDLLYVITITLPITINYNSSQLMTAKGEFRFLLDYDRLRFHYGWLINWLTLNNPWSGLVSFYNLAWTEYRTLSPTARVFVCCNLHIQSQSQSQSQSYITTDGQSASLSWNKAPIRGLRSDFYYCQTVAIFFTIFRCVSKKWLGVYGLDSSGEGMEPVTHSCGHYN